MKVRIEGAGHCVEIEHSEDGLTAEKTVELAEFVWKRTRVHEPRQQIGYGSQLVERSGDRPVAGSHWGESKPEPVQA